MCVFQGEFVACLLTLLRQLKDKEYQQLLSRFPTKDELTVKSFDKPYQSALRLFNQLFNNCDCCSLTLQSGLQSFLLQLFTVFRILIRPDMFPKDWTVMRLVANK